MQLVTRLTTHWLHACNMHELLNWCISPSLSPPYGQQRIALGIEHFRSLLFALWMSKIIGLISYSFAARVVPPALLHVFPVSCWLTCFRLICASTFLIFTMQLHVGTSRCCDSINQVNPSNSSDTLKTIKRKLMETSESESEKLNSNKLTTILITHINWQINSLIWH